MACTVYVVSDFRGADYRSETCAVLKGEALLVLLDEPESALVGGIMAYGDTVFNEQQTPRLVAELRGAASRSDIEPVARNLEEVAEFVERERDRLSRYSYYVVFLGD